MDQKKTSNNIYRPIKSIECMLNVYRDYKVVHLQHSPNERFYLLIHFVELMKKDVEYLEKILDRYDMSAKLKDRCEKMCSEIKDILELVWESYKNEKR